MKSKTFFHRTLVMAALLYRSQFALIVRKSDRLEMSNYTQFIITIAGFWLGKYILMQG
jgi:hypothetical protein